MGWTCLNDNASGSGGLSNFHKFIPIWVSINTHMGAISNRGRGLGMRRLYDDASAGSLQLMKTLSKLLRGPQNADDIAQFLLQANEDY